MLSARKNPECPIVIFIKSLEDLEISGTSPQGLAKPGHELLYFLAGRLEDRHLLPVPGSDELADGIAGIIDKLPESLRPADDIFGIFLSPGLFLCLIEEV